MPDIALQCALKSGIAVWKRFGLYERAGKLDKSAAVCRRLGSRTETEPSPALSNSVLSLALICGIHEIIILIFFFITEGFLQG